jgi:dimethylhistidine N-methyltransferase
VIAGRGLPDPCDRVEIAGARESFARDFLAGLRAEPRSLPPKYFYDEAGSALFDRICGLEEYYLTRTEIALLTRHGAEIADCIGERAEIVEFGAGSLVKIRIVLDALKHPLRYVPIDISAAHLAVHAEKLARDYPDLAVMPLAADFSHGFRMPPRLPGTRRRVGFFPGSSIGNFTPDEALAFLEATARALAGGGLLIGVDLAKDPDILHLAYNDAAGVTAEFNRNLLVRANRELGTDFEVEAFRHYAYYDPPQSRIEMHLVATRDLSVRLAGERFEFRAGQGIHTENSYKYGIAQFRRMAELAGFLPGPVWCDRASLFSVHWLESPPRRAAAD